MHDVCVCVFPRCSVLRDEKQSMLVTHLLSCGPVICCLTNKQHVPLVAPSAVAVVFHDSSTVI